MCDISDRYLAITSQRKQYPFWENAEDHYSDEENGKSRRNKQCVLLLPCLPRKSCLPSHPVPLAKEAGLPAASFSTMVNVTTVLWPDPQLPSIAGCQPTTHKGPSPSLTSSISPRKVWLNWNPWNNLSASERGRSPGIIKQVKITPNLAFGDASFGASSSNSSACPRWLCTSVVDRWDFCGQQSAQQDQTNEGNCLRSYTDSLLLMKIFPSPAAGLKLGHQRSAVDAEQFLAPLVCPPWLGCFFWWEETLGTESIPLRSHWDRKG